ncbi:MAG: hypothetical protein G01um101429_217 [Parcubacteria group bacterium Gr01-1014_29]|nr:MAG: hypothetical protein G01um101429_217 [Parcubacteria group bacterium Gr01-1014_29]
MKELFTPLGIDHLVVACNDNVFWSSQLERLGFIRVCAKTRNEYDEFFGIGLQLGNVNIFLVDPKTQRFEKGCINTFLDRGNMQVVEVGIRVDSIRKANEECVKRNLSPLIPECYFGDTFGDCVAALFRFSTLSSFQYKFVERREPFCPGVDHIAIAVDHLERWVNHYKFWGFEVEYTPQGKEEGLVEGKKSAMRTCALRRDGWAVALVKGVDQKRISQITTYLRMHGRHSIHHAALLFTDIEQKVESYLQSGVQFRLSKVPALPTEPITARHVFHYGEDYGGSLLQCFMKPFARKQGKGGFFFELIKRLSEQPKIGKQAFDDSTVRGLLESIEREEVAGDRGLIFSSA